MTLFKDSTYKLFTSVQIQDLESRIIIKEKCGKQIPHVIYLVRNKEFELTLEEVVSIVTPIVQTIFCLV